MRKYGLYFTDSYDRYDTNDKLKVLIDTHRGFLRLGRVIDLPLCEIQTVELRPMENTKGKYLAIDVCGPTLEEGKPTTLRLTSKMFWFFTRMKLLEEFAHDLRIAVETNRHLASSQPEQKDTEPKLQAQYYFNASVLILLVHRAWYSYHSKGRIARQSLFLMFLGGIVNVAGLLVLAMPYHNFVMAGNLRHIGWSSGLSYTMYVLSIAPALICWGVVVYFWFSWQ